MHYLRQHVLQEINVSKFTKNQLPMKEVIQHCLLFSPPAHPLEMGSVLVQSLYSSSAPSIHMTILLSSTV